MSIYRATIILGCLRAGEIRMLIDLVVFQVSYYLSVYIWSCLRLLIKNFIVHFEFHWFTLGNKLDCCIIFLRFFLPAGYHLKSFLLGMSGYFYQYITVVVRDFLFFHNDVQSTTIAVAIASSLCCSVVWAICHLLTLGSPSAQPSRDKKATSRTSSFPGVKGKRRKSPTNVRLI